MLSCTFFILAWMAHYGLSSGHYCLTLFQLSSSLNALIKCKILYFHYGDVLHEHFTEHNIAFTTSSIQDYYIRLTYDFVENISLFRQLSLNCHRQRESWSQWNVTSETNKKYLTYSRWSSRIWVELMSVLIMQGWLMLQHYLVVKQKTGGKW